MFKLLPRSQLPPGLDKGDYVALSFEEFRHGYDVFSAGIASELPVDHTFPTRCRDGRTGNPSMPDTPFNCAWYSAGKLFAGNAKPVSFYARVDKVTMNIALDRKCARYVNKDAGSFHFALLAAVATVPFSSRTTAKALRAAFDAVDVDDPAMRH